MHTHLPTFDEPGSSAVIGHLDGDHPSVRSGWIVTVLLAGLMVINFLDKVLVGMLAVPIMRDFNLTPVQFGVIAGSVFWLFPLFALLIGFLSNRVSARWIIFSIALIWAIVQVPVYLTSSVGVLLLCRVVLGAAEGPTFNVSVHALCKWFPDSARNIPIAVVNQSAFVGLLLAGFLFPAIEARWGWRSAFMAMAILGMIWLLFWLKFGKEGPIADRFAIAAGGSTGTAHVPYLKLFTDRTILFGYLNAFASFWGLTITLTWLPAYLTKGLGFEAQAAGRIFALVVGVGIPMGLFLGWLSQRLMQRGYGSRIARVGVMGGSGVVAGLSLCLLLLPELSVTAKIVLITIAASLFPMCNAIGPSIFAEVSPSSQRGAVMGGYIAFGQCSGIIAPIVMGYFIQQLRATQVQGYEIGFIATGLLVLIGGLLVLAGQNPARSKLRFESLQFDRFMP